MKISSVSLEWNPVNGHRTWVVDGEKGSMAYNCAFFPHECMVRRMYSESKAHLWELPECNGCSGARHCDRGYAKD